MDEIQAKPDAGAAPAPAAAAPARPMSMLQMLYDDVFLMLLVGLIVPFLAYTVWGFIELLSVPVVG